MCMLKLTTNTSECFSPTLFSIWGLHKGNKNTRVTNINTCNKFKLLAFLHVILMEKAEKSALFTIKSTMNENLPIIIIS